MSYTKYNDYQPWNFVFWELEDYPLSICINRDHFAKREIEAIKDAVHTWNGMYNHFLKRTYPNKVVYGLPGDDFVVTGMQQTPLFIISCKKHRLRRGHPGFVIGVSKGEMEALGTVQMKWAWFVGTSMEIVMDIKATLDVERKSPSRPFFKDVVMHELGHVIGVPHIAHNDLMHSDMEYCMEMGHYLCVPDDTVFESFIELYDHRVLSEQASKKVMREEAIQLANPNRHMYRGIMF